MSLTATASMSCCFRPVSTVPVTCPSDIIDTFLVIPDSFDTFSSHVSAVSGLLPISVSFVCFTRLFTVLISRCAKPGLFALKVLISAHFSLNPSKTAKLRTEWIEAPCLREGPPAEMSETRKIRQKAKLILNGSSIRLALFMFLRFLSFQQVSHFRVELIFQFRCPASKPSRIPSRTQTTQWELRWAIVREEPGWASVREDPGWARSTRKVARLARSTWTVARLDQYRYRGQAGSVQVQGQANHSTQARHSTQAHLCTLATVPILYHRANPGYHMTTCRHPVPVLYTSQPEISLTCPLG